MSPFIGRCEDESELPLRAPSSQMLSVLIPCDAFENSVVIHVDLKNYGSVQTLPRKESFWKNWLNLWIIIIVSRIFCSLSWTIDEYFFLYFRNHKTLNKFKNETFQSGENLFRKINPKPSSGGILKERLHHLHIPVQIKRVPIFAFLIQWYSETQTRC